MITKLPADVNTLYVTGDSWTWGSEMRDLDRPDIKDDFNQIHMQYREEHYWPKLLSRDLNLALVDGSGPGASNQYILRTAIHNLSNLLSQGKKPLAVISWTQTQRFELFNGCNYRQFVNIRDGDLPQVAKEIWGQWSSDHSDIERWLEQIICLDGFMKMNNIPYMSTTVFLQTWRMFEDITVSSDFKPYVYQLSNRVDYLNMHLLNYALESIVRQAGVPLGVGGHPLAAGHRLIADFFKAHLHQRFNFSQRE